MADVTDYHDISWTMLNKKGRRMMKHIMTLTYDDILVDDIFETAASLVGSLTA